jgi:hypothetical protein
MMTYDTTQTWCCYASPRILVLQAREQGGNVIDKAEEQVRRGAVMSSVT